MLRTKKLRKSVAAQPKVLERGSSEPAMDYIDVGIVIVGTKGYQKVGGHITYRTSEKTLMAKDGSDESFKQALEQAWKKIEISAEPLVETIKGGLDMLLQELGSRDN